MESRDWHATLPLIKLTFYPIDERKGEFKKSRNGLITYILVSVGAHSNSRISFVLLRQRGARGSNTPRATNKAHIIIINIQEFDIIQHGRLFRGGWGVLGIGLAKRR